MFGAPIHYRDGESWSPIDSRLVRSDDPGYRWRNAANRFRVNFSEKLGPDFMRFEVNDLPFTMTAQGLLAAPGVADGALVNYRGVAAGVDFRYDVVPTGVKETVVLRDATAPTTFRFSLTAPPGSAMSARREPDGSWAFVSDVATAPLFVLDAPLATEAPINGLFVPEDEAHATLQVEQHGRDFLVELHVDREWLRAADRRFPVEVDPTISIKPSAEDHYFNWGCVTCASPAPYERIYVGTVLGADGAMRKWRGAARFGLEDLPGDAQISSAAMKLRFDACMYAGGIGCSGQHKINAHRLTTPWTTSTGPSELGFDPIVTGTEDVDLAAGSRWLSWNITPTVQAWHDGISPNNGILLKRDPEPDTEVGGPALRGRRTADASLHPTLEVTYTSAGVELLAPETVHGNGADLRWTRYADAAPSAAPFTAYEVHRSGSATFTPSSATLLTTIRDINLTSFRDTTAAPSKVFTYKVLTNGIQSNPQRVTLAAAGHALKVLQPGPERGKSSEIYRVGGMTNCANYGADHYLGVGSTGTDGTLRSMFQFDIRDVPADATIESATMSLFRGATVRTTTTYEAHRLTAGWQEGTGYSEDGTAECTGDGATWYDSQGGVRWATPGGDFEPATAASITRAAGTASGIDDFDLTQLARRWISGDVPNHGVLLKMTDESPTLDNWSGHHGDDNTALPTGRPKLTLNYLDGSYAQAPTVALSQPTADARVAGTVALAAGASDDRRVENVEFLVDGAVVASDATAPYTASWNSATVANGSHAVVARATDDAGNVASSAAVTVTVDNTAPPTASVTAPAANAAVSGTQVTVSANAGDDRRVDRVEFYVGDQRVGEDATAPYAITWNTLDPAQPYFDSATAYPITAKAHDDSGQVTTSAVVNVTVANTSGTKFRGVIAPTAAPQAVTYDPKLTTQETYGFNVTLTNNSSTTWTNSDVKLYYQWYGPDWVPGSPATVTGPAISLGADIRAGKSLTVNNVPVAAPTPADGADRSQWKLRFDLFDVAADTFFAAKGNPPSDNHIIVNKALETGLGLERWWHYEGAETGAGMEHLVNAANGNSILRWSPFESPGRGLSTVVDLTYNSLEQRSESPVGNNFSLSVSGLTRFGNPLDIHPNNADTVAGRSNNWIRFTDGDGTTFRFDAKVNATTGKTYWEEPAGVHLYLREYSTLATTPKKWALTRPDRVTFFYDHDGYPTSVEDANGNAITFTLEATPAGDDPGGPKKRITAITDAAGQGTTPAANRIFRVTYYTKADAPKDHIRGKVKTIADHNGTTLAFAYYEDGNLLRITQKGGTKANGAALADRSLVFTYTTSSGDSTVNDGAAIPDPNLRRDPDPRTPNQSTRLYSVRDPSANETRFTYHGPTSGQLRWKLASRTDRAGARTDYTYDLAARLTTVTAPLGRVSKYQTDALGRPTTITNPANQNTGVTWTADNAPQRITEPTGKYVEYAYDANGSLTDTWDQLRNRTTLAYTYFAVDANDTTGHWKAGRTVAHISQIASKTEPRGAATATPSDDYQWTFGHDTKGNVSRVTDQAKKDTTYTYNSDGTVATITDANGRVTRFTLYDANGLPMTIVDAKNQTTRLAYDDDGNVVTFQDPRHQSDSGPNPAEYQTRFLYDTWGRLGAQSAPKSTAFERGVLIWTGADYDPNDNRVSEVGPHYGATYTGTGADTRTEYDTMDRRVIRTSPDASAGAERTGYGYDTAGRLTSITSPRGTATPSPNDFTEFRTYDPLDRVIRSTRHQVNSTGTITDTLTTHSCYDLAGDLRATTAANANLATVDCAPEITAGATPTTPYTTRHTYDDAHRRVSTTNPLGLVTRTSYDENGNVRQTVDEQGSATTVDYDQRDMPAKITEPLVTTGTIRNIVTRIDYDPVGNRSRAVSPRGWDASTDKATFTDYVTKYVYDELDRLARTDLPTDATTPARFVHNAYDPKGNLAWVSYPTEKTDPSLVGASKKTTYTHFDPGWIRTSAEPCFTDTCADGIRVNPIIHFDYTAEGWQRARTPEAEKKAGSGPDYSQQELQAYFADGKLKERTDAAGLKSSFTYDLDNNQASAVSNEGVTAASESGLVINSTYDTLNRPAKIRQRKQHEASWKATIYGYDRNGNVIDREDDAPESDAGASLGIGIGIGQKHHFERDAADRVWQELDYGATTALTDDQRITRTLAATGWEASERIEGRDAAGTWLRRQLTETTYFANGLPKTKTTKSGANDTTVETHTVAYEAGARYLNGNRATDTFTRTAPTGQTSPCQTSACVQTWTYDARERLVSENDGHGTTTSFALDDASNITSESVNGSVTRRYTYNGGSNQLATTQDPAGNVLTKTYYDDRGNIDCVTSAAAAGQQDCRADQAGNTKPAVLTSYAHDYRDRLVSTKTFFQGAEQTRAAYTYDALDRTTTSSEVHSPGQAPVDKRLTYIGLTTDVTKEDHTQNGAPKATKTFSYDEAGKGYAMTDTPAGQGTQAYTYGHDVHGSVTLLLDAAGAAKASYGYRPYGDANTALTLGDTSTTAPLNPYRYTAKRFDTGSGTYDMGARRFSPDVKRFIELDRYKDALDDLGLGTDPLTQNRYAFTGGNPINYVEVDGHHAVKKSNKRYSFTYTWNWRTVKVPAADVMAAIRKNPSRFFPFPIKCGAAVARGVSCNVKPLPGASDWVDVVSASDRAFTFKARGGHIEGKGSTITFSTSNDRNGGLIFKVHAHGPQSKNVVGRTFMRVSRGVVAPTLWRGMAVNIFCHYNGCDPQPQAFF